MHAHMHARSSFRPRCHVLECPCETLNTSLSATVVPDIDCDPLRLTPAGPSCHTRSLVSHDFSFFFFLFPSQSGKSGRCVFVCACVSSRETLRSDSQNVEGERCLCCARGQILSFLFFSRSFSPLMTCCAHFNHFTLCGEF